MKKYRHEYGKEKESTFDSASDSATAPKTQERAKMSEAAKEVAKEYKMCNILVEGDKIILPDGMSHDDAIKWIQRNKEENERVIAINEVVDAFPGDGAYALTKALSELYGWTSLVPIPGFFGSSPPVMVGIPVNAKGDQVSVPFGRIQIPKVDGYLQTSINIKDGRWIFVISGEIRRKHEAEVKRIAVKTREICREHSIYRGKAIRMNFVDADPRNFDFHRDNPVFIDVDKVQEDELILNKKVRDLISTGILTPISHTEQCRKHKIPLKRGILLEGPYGTGKSLTAYLTAKYAEKNGWTFVYLQSAGQLKKALYFAKQYSPAVVFAEDIDRVVTGERSIEMDEILNTIDGVDTKGAEIITILTTNHIDNINPAMLRPGRLDAIISFEKPDADSVALLVRKYGRELIPDDLEFKSVCTKLEGQIPAIIREVVERAKLGAIRRVSEDKATQLVLNADDLNVAADSMLEHVKFMSGRKFDPLNTQFGQILSILGSSLGDALGKNLAYADMFGDALKAKQEQEKAEKANGNGNRGSVLKTVSL